MKEDEIVKKFNSSRLPWEEAAAHSLGTTVLWLQRPSPSTEVIVLAYYNSLLL